MYVHTTYAIRRNKVYNISKKKKKKIYSFSNVYIDVTLYSLGVSYTMIMWNELHSSCTLIIEIFFLFDQFIQKQAPSPSKYCSNRTTEQTNY